MKTFTNHTLGPRGINTKTGTVWVEPGMSVEIDPKEVVGTVPDLGKKSDDAPASDEAALKQQVADLTKQRDDLAKANAELTKQVAYLTKPAAK